MTDKVIPLAIPTSAKDPELECPFAGVAVPIPAAGGRGFSGLAMQRAACNSHCALYDRVRKRPCIDRALEAIEKLTAAMRGQEAGPIARA